MVSEWCGKAVGDNRRLIPSKRGRWCSNPDYKRFKKQLAWQFKFDARGKMFECPNIKLFVESNYDPTNLIKPVLDALQLAGAIKNDKYINSLYIKPRQKTKRRAADKIEVMLWEGE